jgi:hypothetical protein
VCGEDGNYGKSRGIFGNVWENEYKRIKIRKWMEEDEKVVKNHVKIL